VPPFASFRGGRSRSLSRDSFSFFFFFFSIRSPRFQGTGANDIASLQATGSTSRVNALIFIYIFNHFGQPAATEIGWRRAARHAGAAEAGSAPKI
jgi:hypothetical protein